MSNEVRQRPEKPLGVRAFRAVLDTMLFGFLTVLFAGFLALAAGFLSLFGMPEWVGIAGVMIGAPALAFKAVTK